MLEKNKLKQIYSAENEIASELENISDFIYKNPEIGMEEHIACEYLCRKISDCGFHVKRNFCGIDTAFIAEFDNGPGPSVAFIAEYDALLGFGPSGGPGHACGHNWIAASTFGAFVTLSKLKNLFQGKVILIGAPGMENYGCKADFVRNNVFDHIDVVIQSHLEKYTSVNVITQALDAIQFSFFGNSTHAAQHPEEGVNALDAARFTFTGIDALKNYLRQDINIHGVITEGGNNPTVIPDHTECRFYIRARDREYLNKIRPRIINCAEGAALMTGTKMQFEHFSNPLDNLINNHVLSELAMEYLKLEEIDISPHYQDTHFFGSTDIGNVSHICPTMYIEVAMNLNKEQFTIHSNSAMEYVNSSYAAERLHQMVRIMSASAIEIFNDPELLKNIKKAHRQRLNSETLK